MGKINKDECLSRFIIKKNTELNKKDEQLTNIGFKYSSIGFVVILITCISHLIIYNVFFDGDKETLVTIMVIYSAIALLLLFCSVFLGQIIMYFKIKKLKKYKIMYG